MHPFGIEERDEHLARRDHVARVDFLVDHSAVEGGANGGPIQRGLHFVDGFLRSLEIRFGGSQCRDGLFVILAADGMGLDQGGVSFFIGGSLGTSRFDRCHGRLGLLELGPKIRVVQAHQDVAGLHLLARLEVHFDDSRQQFRADGRLMHGANCADGRFGKRQPNQLHSHHLTFDR